MTPDAPDGRGQVLADLAALGGFFVLAAPPAPGTDAVPWTEALADGALLARFATVRTALAGSSGLPVEQVDPKVAVSATQVGLASRARAANKADALRVRRAVTAPVLLVDDVVTTGATLASAQAALERAGALVLGGLVLAATPAPGAPRPPRQGRSGCPLGPEEG